MLECQTCPLPSYVETDCYNACSERTCANWRKEQSGPVSCTADCQIGPKCVCGGNMYRNDCNVCVNVQECNSTCTCDNPNYVSNNNCYNACSERTCANLKRDQSGPVACTFQCQIDGPKCECATGFYRNNENYQCVTADKCNVTITTTPVTSAPRTPTAVSSTPQVTNTPPRVCPLPNFEPTTCYNECSEHTCANLRKEQSGPVICTKECQVSGGPNGNCVCAGNLYRNDCNVCVEKEHCNTNTTMPCKCNQPFEEMKYVSYRLGCRLPNHCNKWKSCERRSHKRRHCNGKSCKRSEKCKRPKHCRCRRERRYRQVCSCQAGYIRNRCGVCVPPIEVFSIGPCLSIGYEH